MTNTRETHPSNNLYEIIIIIIIITIIHKSNLGYLSWKEDCAGQVQISVITHTL